MTVQSVSDVHVSLMARRCRLQTLLSSIVDAVTMLFVLLGPCGLLVLSWLHASQTFGRSLWGWGGLVS